MRSSATRANASALSGSSRTAVSAIFLASVILNSAWSAKDMASAAATESASDS